MAGLLLLSIAAAFLPLADHLGYESAELVALYAGLLGAVPGVAAARVSPANALRRALPFALFALLVPVAVLLLNGLRRPVCDPLGGLLLYALLAIPSALLAAALGVACGTVAPRRAPWLVALIFLASLAVALWPLWRGPQIFAFHHLGGMLPGPLYDEAIAATPTLWIFRAATMLYALTTCGIAQFAGGDHGLLLRADRGSRARFAGDPRTAGLLLTLIAGGAAVLLSLQAERFHWKASLPQIDRELGGLLETEHLVLHFPREKKEPERELLARDAEASYRAIRAFAGLELSPPSPTKASSRAASAPKIDVYLYRSPAEKRRLIGAAEVSFTKPWLRQVHTNDAPAPHPILRHELAHVVLAEVARGPWGVPGLVPQMAFIEGIAVAADWPPGEFTVHEEARALRELKLLPDVARLFAPGLFYAESGPRAYTTAGSFVRFLWETRGAGFLREAYSGRATLGDLRALAGEYGRFLDALPPSPRATALASQRFFAPAIARKPCAHEVAGLEGDAGAAIQRGDPAQAALLWARCAALEPDDPALLLQLGRAQVAAGDLAAARATQERALLHPKLSRPLRAQLLTEAGDAAWKSSDLAAARTLFDQATELPQSEALERALLLRQRALTDPQSASALRRLLAGNDSGPAVWLALRDLDLARPADGVFAYLLAKQLQNHADWAECATFVRAALSRSLPGPLFKQEALRMQGIAAWHLGDEPLARAAFTALGVDAPPGRALEASRWLHLLAH